MLGLRSAPPVFEPTESEAVARELYGLASSATALTGERDCNFLLQTPEGGQFVLKIFGSDPVNADCQAQVLRHLAEQASNLPVPRVSATLRGTAVGHVVQRDVVYPVCLLSYFFGAPLLDCVANRDLIDDVGRTLGRLDYGLRGFFHPALAQHIAWDVRRLPELLEFSPYISSSDVRRSVERVAGNLTALLPSLRGLQAQAIHNDCHGGNLLVDAAAVSICAVLDFGDMIHGPVILEPAVAMSELLTEGLCEPKALATLLEGYGRHLRLEAPDIAVLFDLIAARHATTILLHAWRDRHEHTGAELLEKAAVGAAQSLEVLLSLGAESLTLEWHGAAGTTEAHHAPSIDLGRRRRLLGAGAELFYEKPLHLVRGADVWLYDRQGNAYLDCYNNVPHVGHCHPTVVRAVQRQTALLATHTRYLHDKILEYAEALLERCPPHLNTCIFVNSGSEANDVAWRIAQHATGQHGGIIMAHAYHGITEAVAALTPGAGDPYDPRVVTLSPPPKDLGFNHALTASSQAAAAQDTLRAIRILEKRGFAPAALFLDTAMTSSGIHDPPQGWFSTVTEQVRDAGGLVIADEVQYGLGRSGSHFWGFERRGLMPDMVTLGKPIGNGFPMGAVLASRVLIESFQSKYGFFSTFGGNPVAACAGLAVLEVIEREQLIANASATGCYLRKQLERLTERHDCLGAVRGSGLLLGLEICGDDATTVRRRTRQIVNQLAADARILIGFEGPESSLLKIRPPMTFRRKHADRLVESIATAAVDIDRKR